MIFDTIKQTAKNKVSVGDEFIIEDGHRTVTKISTQYVYLDNGRYYIKKHFNSWVRIDRNIKDNQESSLRIKNDLALLKKEAKKEYDKKYKLPSKDYLAENTILKFVVMTQSNNVNNEIPKFYFSPTIKADYDDLVASYRSLHGLGYMAIAEGEYILQEDKLVLIGLRPFKNLSKLLSDKRKNFILINLVKEKKYRVYIAESYSKLLWHGAIEYTVKDLLSSPHQSSTQSPTQPTVVKHWSGLNGDIAQDMLDKGLENMYADDDFPF
jgi:hypothetical protein